LTDTKDCNCFPKLWLGDIIAITCFITKWFYLNNFISYHAVTWHSVKFDIVWLKLVLTWFHFLFLTKSIKRITWILFLFDQCWLDEISHYLYVHWSNRNRIHVILFIDFVRKRKWNQVDIPTRFHKVWSRYLREMYKLLTEERKKKNNKNNNKKRSKHNMRNWQNLIVTTSTSSGTR
jgi:hypothetical protein